MNAQRRRQLVVIQARLLELRLRIGEVAFEIETVREELQLGPADAERAAFENMPEGLQRSDRGRATKDAADSLETAVAELDELIDELRSSAQLDNADAEIEKAITL